MAAVMVREAFESGWYEEPGDAASGRGVRGATRPIALASTAAAPAGRRDGVVFDLRERRPHSVLDREHEPVLRLVAPTPPAPTSPGPSPRPRAAQPSGGGADGHVPTQVARRERSSRRAWLIVAAVGLAIVGVAVTDAPAGGRLGGHGGTPTAATPVAEGPAPTISIVVQPGDTLWSIAASLVGDDDPRPLVDELQAARGGSELHPGDVITISAP